jgi:hypothetical protein
VVVNSDAGTGYAAGPCVFTLVVWLLLHKKDKYKKNYQKSDTEDLRHSNGLCRSHLTIGKPACRISLTQPRVTTQSEGSAMVEVRTNPTGRSMMFHSQGVLLGRSRF